MKAFPFISRLFVVCCILFSILGCGKSSDGPSDSGTSFLRCKINGQLRNFNFHVNANDKPSTDVVHFVVVGGWEGEDMMKSAGFGFDLVLPDGAKEKTYTVAGDLEPELDGQYYFQNYVNGKLTGTTVYSGGRSDDTNFTLTITSLNSWGVKGKFSGLLRLSGGSELMTVTEGEFSAPYN